MYLIPIPDISNPPTAVPRLIPQLEQDTNNPLANSGASVAAEVIQYWLILFCMENKIPKSTYIITIEIGISPVKNHTI